MNNPDGMTVLERLYHFGLLEDFDKRIEQRDQAGSIEVLTRAELSVEHATETVQAVLKKSQIRES